MRNNQYLNAGRNEESDECLTPRYAVEPVVKYLKAKDIKIYYVLLIKKIVISLEFYKEKGFL